MATQLTVKINNESQIPGTAVVYQQYPGGASGFTLAWMVTQAQPGNPTTLAWSDQLAFVWGLPGSLPPGTIFQAAQALPADPSGENEVTLTEGPEGQLTDLRSGGPVGRLTIVQDPSVVPGQIAVGIGMSNVATAVVPARPAITTTFNASDLQYWIAFGTNFQQGQVLGLSTIQNPAQLVFPPGGTNLSAVFSQDGQWTISPSG